MEGGGGGQEVRLACVEGERWHTCMCRLSDAKNPENPILLNISTLTK